MHNRNPWANCSSGHSTLIPHMFPLTQNVKFYYCHTIEWYILVERSSEKMQHFLHLSREIGHSTLQNSDCACAVLFCCYLPVNVTQLQFDFIKHAVPHFAPFLAPFLLELTILCFSDTNICWFFPHKIHTRKHWKAWKSKEKKHENLPGNFCPMLPIMWGQFFSISIIQFRNKIFSLERTRDLMIKHFNRR